jgi:hypothetical protein
MFVNYLVSVSIFPTSHLPLPTSHLPLPTSHFPPYIPLQFVVNSRFYYKWRGKGWWERWIYVRAVLTTNAMFASVVMHISKTKHGLNAVAQFNRLSSVSLNYNRVSSIGLGVYTYIYVYIYIYTHTVFTPTHHKSIITVLSTPILYLTLYVYFCQRMF